MHTYTHGETNDGRPLDSGTRAFMVRVLRKTKGADVKAEHWNDVIDAFRYAQAYSVRRAVKGKPVQYVRK